MKSHHKRISVLAMSNEGRVSMLITKMLLQKQLDRLVRELDKLLREVNDVVSSEAAELQEHIERKYRQIQGFRLTLSYTESEQSAEYFQDLQAALYQMKVEFRLMRRKWKRYLTTESRIRKIQERKDYHAPVFAA